MVTEARPFERMGRDGCFSSKDKAKVFHGHHFYFVYLHQPLPELRSHIHEKAVVTLRSNGGWSSIRIHDDYARIHKTVRLHR